MLAFLHLYEVSKHLLLLATRVSCSPLVVIMLFRFFGSSAQLARTVPKREVFFVRRKSARCLLVKKLSHGYRVVHHSALFPQELVALEYYLPFLYKLYPIHKDVFVKTVALPNHQTNLMNTTNNH